MMVSGEQQGMFVRRYRPGDDEHMVHVFRETADENLRNAGDPALHFASYIWCRPYYLLTPETCFVLDDGNGRAVGYVVGTSDTSAFVQQWREDFLPILEQEQVPNPGPDEPISWEANLPTALRFLAHSPGQLLHPNNPELLEQYPAHLHIDILPSHQRSGMGRILIESFVARMRNAGARGVHLGMNASNSNAMKFYQRMGFERFQRVMDGGKSGESGREGTTIYMVISL